MNLDMSTSGEDARSGFSTPKARASDPDLLGGGF
jgi:hypothetical protein